MTDNERISTGYAALQGGSNTVHGVALGVGDETKGASGKRTVWPPAVLEEAAEQFEGVPIVKNHPNIKQTEDGVEVTGQAPIDAKVGEITRAKYKPDVGVLWEGKITDDDMLSKVENGIAEVSPVLQREIKQVDEDTFEATAIHGVRDLGLVSRGASPSNSIDTGAAAMSAEALAQEFGAEALKEVSGVEFSGTKDGKLDESEIEDNFGDHALYGSGENKEDYSYWVVDADGNLRKGNVESAWELGCRGQCPSDETHDEKVRALAQEFENPPIDMDAESMGTGVQNAANWEACNVELPDKLTQSDDGANGSSPQSSVVADSNEETMSDDNLTETEEAILAAADSVDEPVEALEEYAATEGPTIVEQDSYESLQEQIGEIEGFMREALSEKTDLKDSTLEALEFEALRAEFENDEGDFEPEALVQNPETGEPESSESGAEALSDDADTDKAEALYADMQEFGVDHEDKIVEALGVEDFDAATEVLN